MLRHLRKQELEEKLRIFRRILAEATTDEEKASAQGYITKYKAELKRMEVPDEAYRA